MLVALPAFFALVPLAADVLTVAADGSAAFPDIQSAIDAAQDGDTVLVADGSYPGFSISAKDVAVIAATPSLPDPAVSVEGSVHVTSIALGSQVLLRGLAVSTTLEPALVAAQFDGRLWLESSTFASKQPATFPQGTPTPGVTLDGVEDVRFLLCGVSGSHGINEGGGGGAGAGAAGLRATDSNVHAYNSSFRGGNGGSAIPYGLLDSGAGGSAIELSGSRLRLWGSSAVGANGGYPDYCFCPGALYCGDPGSGGDSVRVLEGSLTASSVELRDATLQPGAGGENFEPQCPDGDPGVELANVPSENLVTFAGPHRSYYSESPVRDGGDLRLFFSAAPSDVAIVAYGPPKNPTQPPGLAGLLFLGTPLNVLYAGPAPEQALTFAIPQQPAGFQSLRLFTQGAILTPSGSLELLAPASVLLIDDAY